MIKLKHLLQESTNIELHKVITEKDNPPFMTEEQWLKKWDTNILNESIFENLNEDEIKSIKDIKPQLPLLKRAVAKLLTNIYPNPPTATATDWAMHLSPAEP